MAALTGFTDGLFNFGSRVLTIGTFTAGTPPTYGSTATYVADNITIQREASKISQTNQIGKPTGNRYTIGEVTGTAEVQLATASTNAPQLFYAFKDTFQDIDYDGDVTADDEHFVIHGVSQPFVKDGETKVNITFSKILNPASAAATTT